MTILNVAIECGLCRWGLATSADETRNLSWTRLTMRLRLWSRSSRSETGWLPGGW
jgi:hypothetical protein